MRLSSVIFSRFKKHRSVGSKNFLLYFLLKRWKHSFNGFSSSVVDNKKEIELTKVFVKIVELHFKPIQTITQILNPLHVTIIYFRSPYLVDVQATLNNSKRINFQFWRMEEFRRRIQVVKCLFNGFWGHFNDGHSPRQTLNSLWCLTISYFSVERNIWSFTSVLFDSSVISPSCTSPKVSLQ